MAHDLTPKDLIALVIIVFCFIAIYFGINHLVSYVLIAVVAYYFGSNKLRVKRPEK